MIAFAFILWHVIQMHKMGAGVPGGGQFDAERGSSSVAITLRRFIVRAVRNRHRVGRLPLSQRPVDERNHLGHLGRHRRPMRRAGWICGAFGIFIGLRRLSALVGFGRTDVEKAQKVEERMEAGAEDGGGEVPVTTRFESGNQVNDECLMANV